MCSLHNNTKCSSVEAFEVLKLGFGTDFCLLTAHKDNTRAVIGYRNPFPQDILEWHREVLQENPVLKR